MKLLPLLILILVSSPASAIYKELNDAITEPVVITELPEKDFVDSDNPVETKESFKLDQARLRWTVPTYSMETTGTSNIQAMTLDGENTSFLELYWQIESGAYFQPYMSIGLLSLEFADTDKAKYNLGEDSGSYFSIETGLRTYLSMRTSVVVGFSVEQTPFPFVRDEQNKIAQVTLPVFNLGFNHLIGEKGDLSFYLKGVFGLSLPKEKEDAETDWGYRARGELDLQYWISRKFYAELVAAGSYGSYTIESTSFKSDVTNTVYQAGLSLGFLY